MRLGPWTVTFVVLAIGLAAACAERSVVEAPASTTDAAVTPSGASAGPGAATPTIAAQTLFDAWQAHDRPAALEVATDTAVRNLWAAPPDGYAFKGPCEPAHCSFENQGQLVAFFLEVSDSGEGYRVDSADIGTIESPVPSGG